MLNIVSPVPAGISRQRLNRAFDLVFAKLKPKASWQINLAFVTKSRSRELNKRYASNDYPTDVLSFNYQEGSKISVNDNQFIGDIIICPSIAKSQASKFKTDLTNEICLLLVHAVIHLLGYDHKGNTQQAGFEALQNAIISELKLSSRILT
ncbi:MAG: rRNA maturation RNase YbeY [bacterium]|nr:rRNA maturation RNase YbeY [bacterium]